MATKPAGGADFHAGLELGASYSSHANFLDRGDLDLPGQRHFSDDRSYMSIKADPYLSFNLGNHVGGFVQASADWENPRFDETDDAVQTDLNNAYLTLSGAGASLAGGLQTIYFGNGLIMADNVPAVILDVAHGKAYMQCTWARALDNSPMLAATIGLHPGDYEHAALFGIWFNDQDDAFAKAVPLIYRQLLEPESEGDLYWAGVSAELFVGRAQLSILGAYEWGRFRLFNATQNLSRNVNAYFADLSLEGNLSDWCSLGAFVYIASGDDTPARGDMNAFVAITPFNPRVDIFFDSEFLGRNTEDDKLTFNGGFFGGVIAPGLTLNLIWPSGLSVEATLATFYAHQPLDDGSQWYGWELDLGVSYSFAHHYTLYAEAARFEHGNYYESLLNEKVDPATRYYAGLRVSI